MPSPPGIDIDRTFMYHKPTGDQPERYVTIRDQAKAFAHLIDKICPGSAEKTLAIRHVQQAVMFANASIAIHDDTD